ncbi:MAG: TA system antitoxin ParD family protein [Bdellovibrionales bacterium]
MVSVNLSDDLVAEAKHYAAAFSRSVPKQIEHWAKVGKIADENPELSASFINDILLAMEEDPIPFDLSELDEE